MTNNPLVLTGKQKKTWDLDEFCEASNRFNWVRQSGRPYFITTKRDDNGDIVYDEETGNPIRYLDRNA